MKTLEANQKIKDCQQNFLGYLLAGLAPLKRRGMESENP
jgi:hypothetical protein